MPTRLRWGLLSTAKINRSLIPPLKRSRRSQLSAVASRSLDHAQQYAAEYGIPRAFGSYEALLADPDIDVIYNSLPNHLHAEWTIRALQAGKHVLLEKPLALTVAEVRQVAAAARTSGCVVAEAFMYRHHPQTLKAQQLVTEGALGEMKFINGHFILTFEREGNFRWDPQAGGGSLWDVGCYPLSFARMLTGCLPEQVSGWQTLTPEGVDLTFCGQMRYASGVMSQLLSSFGLPYHTGMEVHGTEASLFIPDPFTPHTPRVQMLLKTRDHREFNFTFRKADLYQGEVQDLESAILDGTPPLISLQESQDNVATLLALYQSAAESGRALKIQQE